MKDNSDSGSMYWNLKVPVVTASVQRNDVVKTIFLMFSIIFSLYVWMCILMGP